MSASVETGVQTWPVIGTSAVAVAPLPSEEAKAKASPHPSPLPQAGEGAGLPHPMHSAEQAGPAASTQAGAPADPLPLPPAGEGWGEGRAEAGQPTAPAMAPEATGTTTSVAQPATFAQPPGGAGMVGTTIVTLVLVIGFILLLAWLAKRMPGIGSASNPALKIVGSLPLGPRERVVVVAVGDTQLLLATGPNGTRALHTLEQPLPVAASAPSPFAQVLAQQFGKKKP